MNTIFFSKKYELQPGVFVMPFSCSDIDGVRTELLSRDRSDTENKTLSIIWDRVALVLKNKGFSVETVNFNSMSITARKVD